jgi:hydroxylysine kinase
MKTSSTALAIRQLLTTQPPGFSSTGAAEIAASRFGISGSAHPLVSERDQNFRIDSADGRRFVLKISNQAERAKTVDFQNSALQHAAQYDESLPLPRVIRNLDGATHCLIEREGKPHLVRMISWLNGEAIADRGVDQRLAHAMGQLLARLGLAFRDFEHPGSNPALLWDMKRASLLRELLSCIEDRGLEQIAEKILDQFDTLAKPRLESLRTQVIHNDLNPDNVLIDPTDPCKITGVIDFGDLVKSPLIIDLAVAAAYQLGEGSEPLTGALPMIDGYASIRPLEDREIEILSILIRTRLVTSLLIGSYRAKLFPENREYLLISQKAVIAHLKTWQAPPESDAEAITRFLSQQGSK